MTDFVDAPRLVRAATGDNYWAIARRLGWTNGAGLDAAALAIQQANGLAKLYPGQYVAIPPEAIPPAAPPPPPPPPPEPTIHEAIDFAAPSLSGWYFATQLLGRGRDVDTYRVKPASSTRPPMDPSNPELTTPHRVVRVGPTSAPASPAAYPTGIVVRDVTIAGYAEQVAHTLTLSYTRGALIERIRVVGHHGRDTRPPEETFGVELHRAIDPVVRDVLVDGRRPDGSRYDGTLFAFNSVDGAVVEGLVANHCDGFAAALWQSGNYRLVEPDLRHCRRVLNLERPYGTIEILRPDCRNRTSPRSDGPDVVVATAGFTPVIGPQAGVRQMSATVHIEEPLFDRDRGFPFHVAIPTLGAPYTITKVPEPHSQRVEDVTVRLDGVLYRGPVSNSLVRIGGF